MVSNYYKYMVMLGDADRPSLKKLMREEFDVGLSGEVYDTPLHKQPVFAPWVNGDRWPWPKTSALVTSACRPQPL